tara:strand:+ start:1014 stop:1295 length:282 start_codon:yes stop_codon:yes gene_type:complete
MAKRDLTKEQLAESFSIATLRMHNLIDEFYEDLHERNGSPCINAGIIANMITVMKTLIDHELELIRDASYEHFESNYDEGEQAKILFEDGLGS